MVVIFRLDRKIQILLLDSPIESGNDGLKRLVWDFEMQKAGIVNEIG
jgi:hypothetical protein